MSKSPEECSPKPDADVEESRDFKMPALPPKADEPDGAAQKSAESDENHTATIEKAAFVEPPRNSCPYAAPDWAQTPPVDGNRFKLDVLKNGSIVETLEMSGALRAACRRQC